MSRYKSEQTAYSPLKKKYVPLWKLDTNTVTVTHFNADTQTEESKTYNTDFIRYHLHFSDSHCPDRLRRLVNEGKIQLKPLQSKHFAFADYLDAYKYIEANKEKTMKVLIDVDPED